MSHIGLTAPKLLPIAGTWATPFALYFGLLSFRVVQQRLKTNHFIGDKAPTTETIATSISNQAPEPSELEIASRCHGNFLENVPLAFVFLAVAELNGGNRKALNYVMGTFFALRIAHSELGLRLKGKFGGGGVGRPLGFFGSLGVLSGLAGYSAYLIKGYWGF